MDTPEPGYASWMLAILPQIENEHVYQSHNFQLPVFQPANSTSAGTIVGLYLCPDDRRTSDRFISTLSGTPVSMAYASYVGNLGSNFIVDSLDWGVGVQPDGVLYRQSTVRPEDIIDGTSHTLMAGERQLVDPLMRPVWAFGFTGKVVGDVSTGILDATDERVHWGFSSYHPAGAHFLMADGSVRMLGREIDSSLFGALATRGGQEPESDSAF